MARIRSIHPGIASDESYMAMSMAAKAAWPILWTECDDHGIFEWKPIVLKARIFPADNINFEDILSELEALDCIKKVDIEGKPWGIVRNFRKYQRPKKPSYRFKISEELEEYIYLKKDERETSSPPVPHQFRTGSEKSNQMKDEGWRMKDEGRSSLTEIEEHLDLSISEKSTERVIDKKPAKPRKYPFPDNAFEIWYSGYPSKVGRGAAEKAFEKTCKSDDVSFDDLVDGVRRYKTCKPPDWAYCNPATWLNQKRWLDEPAQTATSPPQSNFECHVDPSTGKSNLPPGTKFTKDGLAYTVGDDGTLWR